MEVDLEVLVELVEMEVDWEVLEVEVDLEVELLVEDVDIDVDDEVEVVVAERVVEVDELVDEVEVVAPPLSLLRVSSNQPSTVACSANQPLSLNTCLYIILTVLLRDYIDLAYPT